MIYPQISVSFKCIIESSCSRHPWQCHPHFGANFMLQEQLPNTNRTQWCFQNNLVFCFILLCSWHILLYWSLACFDLHFMRFFSSLKKETKETEKQHKVGWVERQGGSGRSRGRRKTSSKYIVCKQIFSIYTIKSKYLKRKFYEL